MIIVIAHMEEAGSSVKEFMVNNGRLPNYVHCLCYNDSVNRTVVETDLSMPQFLYAATAILSNPSVYDAEIINVNPATSPSGNFTSGNIQESEYRHIAENIKNFIETNGRAPNFANSSLGELPFKTLIDMYARIWAFIGEKRIPPTYVSV